MPGVLAQQRNIANFTSQRPEKKDFRKKFASGELFFFLEGHRPHITRDGYLKRLRIIKGLDRLGINYRSSSRLKFVDRFVQAGAAYPQLSCKFFRCPGAAALKKPLHQTEPVQIFKYLHIILV